MFSEKNNKNTLILSGALSVTAIIELVLAIILKNLQTIDFIKCLLTSIILIFCIVYYIVSKAEEYYKDKFFIYIVSGVFLIYMTIATFSNEFLLDIAFYLTGGILLSMLTDYHLGILMNFGIMSYVIIFYQKLSYELIFDFAISLLLCMLFKQLKDYISLLFICIIAVALQLIAALLRHDFELEKVIGIETLGILVTTFLFIAAAFIIRRLVADFRGQDSEEKSVILSDEATVVSDIPAENTAPETATAEIAATAETSAAPAQNVTETVPEATTVNPAIAENAEDNFVAEIHTVSEVCDNYQPVQEPEKYEDYKEFLSTNFALYVHMKDNYAKTFAHSKLVADLARNIAVSVKANSDLCYVGALYHEIGKLAETADPDAENRLIREYNLPEKIASIIRQHNYKNELPTSIESVIVMISDNIVTMYEFMLKSGKEIVMPKLVDNTFQLHFNKGTIEEAGISIKEFNRLRQTFQTEMAFFQI